MNPVRPPELLLLGFVLAAAVGACGRDATAPVGLQGTYTLRSVGPWTPPYAELPLPTSVVPGDTIRYLAGAFVLTENGRWHERVVREVVGGGSVHTDTLGGDGSYRVSTDTLHRALLDLYPGLRYIAINNSIAVISGDTLYHAPWIFVR